MGKQLKFFETVLENMRQGVITTDSDGKISSFNPWAEQIFGFTQEEVIGENINIIMPDDERLHHDNHIARYHEQGKARVLDRDRDDLKGQRKNGETFPILLRVTHVKRQDENFFVGLVSDISEQKKKEQETLEARQEAIRANHAKSEFLANISHELRTPLNAIIGMTRLLCEDDNMSPDNRNTANIVYRSATNLLDIVNDILDLSKIEAREVILENIAYSYKEVFSDIFDELLIAASEKGLLLKHEANDNGVEYIVGDPLRLRRIIVNLVSNAIKYTAKGSVTIAYEFIPAGKKQDKAMLACTVSDTGIGIPADKLDAVFDKFAQADASTTRQFGGTGLGLSITKELVELMGGQISVESTPGEGSSFRFVIPVRIAQERDHLLPEPKKQLSVPCPPSRKPIGQAHILVAEDHLMNQAFMRKLFHKWGVRQYEIVENGDDAIKHWRDGGIDLIMMDCHMPGKGGYEATGDIRKEEAARGAGERIPIIALTADAMIGTRERCMKAGMDFYVTKPIDIDELQAIVSRLFEFPETARPDKAEINLDLLGDFASTKEEIDELVAIFMTESKKSLATLRKNQIAGKNTDWVEAAHKLKGGAAMLGACTLGELCERAQQIETATSDMRRQAFKEINSEYKRVCKALADLQGKAASGNG